MQAWEETSPTMYLRTILHVPSHIPVSSKASKLEVGILERDYANLSQAFAAPPSSCSMVHAIRYLSS